MVGGSAFKNTCSSQLPLTQDPEDLMLSYGLHRHPRTYDTNIHINLGIKERTVIWKCQNVGY